MDTINARFEVAEVKKIAMKDNSGRPMDMEADVVLVNVAGGIFKGNKRCAEIRMVVTDQEAIKTFDENLGMAFDMELKAVSKIQVVK
jgi:hypothetical protein